MSERHRIGLQLLSAREHARGERARRELARALEGATLTEPDADGTFETEVEDGSREAAIKRVIDAIAAAGVDDDVAILEHPDVPHHWERTDDRPPPGP